MALFISDQMCTLRGISSGNTEETGRQNQQDKLTKEEADKLVGFTQSHAPRGRLRLRYGFRHH